MRIDNIVVSNKDIKKLTATVSFDIIDIADNTEVLIKINDKEYSQLSAKETKTSVLYNIKGLQRGINNINIKLVSEDEEYISEPFLIKLKYDPSIEGLVCSYSDSTGKFILDFTIVGDELFTYDVDFKLDEDDYSNIMTCQIQGKKSYESVSTMGNHSCKLKVTDGYDIYETDVFSFEIVNQKPILSRVLVTNISNNGTASIHYAVKDIENSVLVHKLNLGGEDVVINPNKSSAFYTYELSNLAIGIHTCYISVDDGIDTVKSENFTIEIFEDATDRKGILKQAKDKYDFAYQSLKEIILSVVSDGIFDYDIENAIIQKAQEYYIEMYSEFNRIAQQSIDTIGTNKVTVVKEDLELQINDVDTAITNLGTTMETTFRDGILTDTEKDILRNNLDLVAKEKSDIDRDYETLYNNVDLIDPTKTKLSNAYNEFINAHNNLVLDVDRIINKIGIIDDNDKDGLSSLFEVWRGALGNYRVASLESIDSIAKKRVDDSVDVLTQRWSDLQVDLNGIKLEVGSLEERVENVIANVDTSVQTVQIMYYLSESVTELKGGTWLDVAPTWEQGKYMWSKTVTHLTNGDKTETKPVCIAGAKGQDGVNAIQYYTWVRYSSNEDGSNMTSEPNENTVYIGIAVNKTSKTPSENKEDYTWSKFMGDDGVDGKDGSTTYTWMKYADDSSGNGLSDNPTNKTYIGFAYNKTIATESTNASDYSWSLIKGSDGIDGEDGVGVQNIVELYYLSTSKTTQTDGSWVTTCPTWEEGKYLWTRTKVEYTDGTEKYTDPLCDTSWEKTNELNTNVQTITTKVSDIEVKTDSITSTVSTMQTSVTNLGTRVTNAETKVTQLDNKITSSVTEDDVKSIIEQSPTEIRYGFNDISDYVTISSSGLTVNRGSVACDLLCTPSGHDPIIKLFGSNGNCAIDATMRYNSGWGTAIRLKWDDYNYYYISDNVATIYQYGYESFMFQTDPTYRDKSKIMTPNGILVFDGSNSYDIYDNVNKRLTYEGVPIILQKSKFVETASVGGGGSWYDKDRPGSGLYFASGTTIGMYAGKNSSSTATGMFTFFWDTDSNPVMRATHTSKNLTFGVSGLYYGGNLVLTDGNYTNYCAKVSHGTHVSFGGNGSASTCARSDHSHSGYAPSSHTHDIIKYGSSYVDCYSSSITISTSDLYLEGGNIHSNSIEPNSTNTYNLGWSSYRWQQITAKNVYADYCSGSDSSIKENIRYIKPTNVSLFSGDTEPEELLNPNSDNNINLGVSGIDLYEFVKNDLKLCEYNYNDDYIRNGKTGEVIKTNFDNKIGFIAQDLQDSYVGQLIVGEWEGQLSYNLNNYVSVLGGALQYEIATRDAQIESLESTISDLEERIKELENKLK